MILWTFVHIHTHTYKGKDSWWLYAMSKNLYRKIIMMKKETKCAKNARRKAKGTDDAKVDASFLGDWTWIWTSRTACVRACVRVLKSSCEERVRLCVSIRARGDTSPGAAFFSSHKWRRMRARSSPLTNSLSTDTHRKKKILAFFPPPRHDLVVSWGSLGVLFGVRVLLIERTYLNSCLRLVRTKLSSRAYVFLPLFMRACMCMRVCVDVVYMFSVFVRVCDIKVSCRKVPSFISQVCHLFSVIMTILFSHCRSSKEIRAIHLIEAFSLFFLVYKFIWLIYLFKILAFFEFRFFF